MQFNSHFHYTIQTLATLGGVHSNEEMLSHKGRAPIEPLYTSCSQWLLFRSLVSTHLVQQSSNSSTDSILLKKEKNSIPFPSCFCKHSHSCRRFVGYMSFTKAIIEENTLSRATFIVGLEYW